MMSSEWQAPTRKPSTRQTTPADRASAGSVAVPSHPVVADVVSSYLQAVATPTANLVEGPYLIGSAALETSGQMERGGSPDVQFLVHSVGVVVLEVADELIPARTERESGPADGPGGDALSRVGGA